MGDASREILQRARQHVPEWSPAQVHEALAQREKGQDDQSIVLVDVREKHEWNEGHIPGALHVPRGFLELQIEEKVPDKSKTVVLYCAGGVRSLMAGATLQQMGYENVISMAGGFGQWKGSGLNYVLPRTLNEEQTKRYSRHLLIPEVGEAGQLKLLDSKVLLIGAGGLGSPAAYYLAAAGVGTIGIIDADVVDETNLQRQILHNTERIGQYKAESAQKTLKALNPDINVVTYIERLDETNVRRLVAEYDVILDGTDNFPTRYMLNDAAIIENKPVVHGSVFRFEGQLTVFKPHEGPCYRCLYPSPPPPELAPSCAEAGVLGVLPGTIGLLQATETIKLLLGLGEPLVGRLMTYDALSAEVNELKLYRDPQCPACGENAHPEDLPTYADVCALTG
ncbi:molybdopterin/thiamine biosynthesis adenylyltransferase [Thermosporothrix hazakensis]|uniref:Molybdopterin/thiamine biosynthesis adenylyltransferase n=2 Tax=Thermosporothrix TaxID=768650 RepID=A0A326U705_THEHA|nr:molybdopterin-synthase adenylyltransferase MoeB [Thermosporothrix hazakensis]PZW30578.1 molybdopterin/thiamine biosynthesis adenylyltransferase [Thermosporothrix hazakensis]BBH91293.1 molybdopterin biosynthesis protein MoeB [Thermosporothrix sp. COM3]GCE49440.1 molybdopterin biosynthesis protein MoeB [Thermosporothrix hazakensis]